MPSTDAIKIRGLPDPMPTDPDERAVIFTKLGDGFIRMIGEIIDAGKISPFEAVRAIDAAYREETSAELKDMLAYVLLHVRARALTGKVSP
jgi:hypothetical protein